MSTDYKTKEKCLETYGTLQNDTLGLNNVHACAARDGQFDDYVEIPSKKRKTRRGKCKRRNGHPYYKNGVRTKKVIKPKAPYNSNRFLIEDHGNMDEIDEELKNADQMSNSTVTRTRDSSFSVDSDGEFYSTPDDEEEFLIRDFDNQYESLQAERLQSMTKNELIQEYLQLETRLELMAKKMRSKEEDTSDGVLRENDKRNEYRQEIEHLMTENDCLKRENELLTNKLSRSCISDSEDSENDSSESCETSSLSSINDLPILDNHPETNGHLPVPINDTTAT